MAFSNSNLSLTPEEQKALHWDGIVAVCTGKFQNLTEAKAQLEMEMRLKKSGLNGALLSSFQQDPAIIDMLFAINSGQKWGDIWYDQTQKDMERTKKELRKTYVELALETEGRWRLGAKKIQLEERLLALQTELGMSQA
jgi:hypothetical protein